MSQITVEDIVVNVTVDEETQAVTVEEIVQAIEVLDATVLEVRSTGDAEGATGSFTTADGKSVTVVGGFITQIEDIASDLDSDAQAFVNAASLTDDTQIDAVNNLVIGLKGAGLWSKMIACYPFVGGNSLAHSLNLKDPRNTDEAYRITFHGSPVHSANGVAFDGLSKYADTHLIPQGLIQYNNNHISMYSRTAAATNNGLSQYYDMGSGDDSHGGYAIFVRREDNSAAYDCGDAAGNRVDAGNGDGSGFFIGATDGNIATFYKSGSILGQKSIGNSSYGNAPVYVGAFNEYYTGSAQGETHRIYYSPRQFSFASIGIGMSNSQALSYSQIVQQFQTALGR